MTDRGRLLDRRRARPCNRHGSFGCFRFQRRSIKVVRQVDGLEVHGWNAETGEWDCSRLTGPSWPQIEAAIRAMDSAARPQVDIVLNEKLPLGNCLSIRGGNGSYWLGGTTGNGRWVEYRNRSVEG